MGLIPGQGTKILHATWGSQKQNKTTRAYYNQLTPYKAFDSILVVG